jgi:hypothetical protein
MLERDGERLQVASTNLLEEGLELAPGVLDGIRLRVVGRKVKNSRAHGFNRFTNPDGAMNSEVVEDDDVARVERRRERLLAEALEASPDVPP